MSLIEKLSKGYVKNSSILTESKFFIENEPIPTDIPIINAAFNGDLINGGIVPGLTVFAGESKTFKTLTGLFCVKAYLNHDTDAICLFYDSEFGTNPGYLNKFGIDTNRLLHIPIENIEDLKFDVIKRLESVERGEKVIIFIDSVGNLASKKEVEDAENAKSVADMSRAKALKSLFRILTPILTTKKLPCIAINHVYNELGMFPKAIISGGCVVAGTEIQTPEGLKPVELFKPGDVVMTSYGQNTVSHVWNPDTLEEGNPECYKITFEDGHSIICSENHKFLVDNEWIEAKDLVEGMNCSEK